jgi:hypothetical protein
MSPFDDVERNQTNVKRTALLREVEPGSIFTLLEGFYGWQS